MADKKFITKNGLLTNNTQFVDEIGNSTQSITLTMDSLGTLSFDGSNGQLFSVTDNMTGTIFSVNDISGIPSIEVDDTGDIRLAEFDGDIDVGNTSALVAEFSTSKMRIGGGLATDDLAVQGDGVITGALQVNGNIVTSGSVDGIDVSGINVALTGDVSGSATVIADGSIDISTTIQPNSVALGTDTTGNYVQQGATSGNGISGSVNSEGGTFTVTSNATTANTANTIVYRDASGSFSAGTIVASLSGNATTATTATNITGGFGTDQSGYRPLTINGILENVSTNDHNHTLDSLSNTTITSNTSGEILKWNGTAWVNNTLAEAGIQPAGTYDNYVSWTIQDGDTTSYTVTSGDILQIASGTGITSNFTADDVLTITNTAPNVTTNLSTTHNTTTVVVNSSDGTNATINGATTTTAGIVTNAAQTFAGNKTFNNDVIIGGNLTINGTTTTLNTTDLLVEDKNIVIGNVTTPSDTTADGGGITLLGTTNKTIIWDNATDKWLFNQGLTVTGDVSATTFTGPLSGNASTATTLQTARTINGTSFNGSANITTANWGTARTLTIGNTGKSVNGSANVSWSLAEIGALSSSSSIEDLSDVNTMTPTDGQVLTWDNANSRWDAADATGGGTAYTGYDFVATNAQTVFSVTYDNANLVEVYSNGLLLKAGEDYSLSAGTTLTLTQACEAGDRISAQVFVPSDLYVAPEAIATNLVATSANQTVFTANYTVSRVEVFVDGMKLNPNQYTATNGTSVTLNSGVDIGTWVQVFSNTDAAVAGTIAWGNVTGTPTTIAGYSITDAASTISPTFSGTATFADVTITGTLTETSAKKYKENIKPLENSLENILKMQGVKYNKIGSDEIEIGLIADEVEKIRPEYVKKEDNEIEGLHYQRIVADLIEAVKTQQDHINKLEQKINELENK